MPNCKELEAIQLKIVDYVRRNPDMYYATVCENLNISRPSLVYILNRHGFRRNKMLNRLNFAALEN